VKYSRVNSSRKNFCQEIIFSQGEQKPTDRMTKEAKFSPNAAIERAKKQIKEFCFDQKIKFYCNLTGFDFLFSSKWQTYYHSSTQHEVKYIKWLYFFHKIIG
jgi:hypothetical protein